MSDEKLVAQTTLYAIDKDGREFDIYVMVGLPYETEFGAWACPVAIVGLHGRLHDIYGNDSFQSLILAIKLIHNLLIAFVNDGGKLHLEKGGETISVDELFGKVVEMAVPDGPPTGEQQERIDKLTPDHLRLIDEAILACVSSQWRKAALVVGTAMEKNLGTVPPVPDIFYSQRLKKLVEDGSLESQGNLESMRLSEVRLPEHSTYQR